MNLHHLVTKRNHSLLLASMINFGLPENQFQVVQFVLVQSPNQFNVIEVESTNNFRTTITCESFRVSELLHAGHALLLSHAPSASPWRYDRDKCNDGGRSSLGEASVHETTEDRVSWYKWALESSQ